MGDAVILSSLSLGWTRVVLVGHYQSLTLVGRWPLPVLFDPVLGDSGRPCVLGPLLSIPVPLGSPVEGLASFVGCDVLWGHHFLITYNTV